MGVKMGSRLILAVKVTIATYTISGGSKIPQTGSQTPYAGHCYLALFAENCMKIKEIEPRGECILCLPLDPPMTIL